ncbi:MAG TPA: Gfo/Idh/MocA family oxidoreductase [Humisphaera sp.]|nr:Gfo/Idh/MocA family oxidoreductase [Humisphaera sp.]
MTAQTDVSPVAREQAASAGAARAVRLKAAVVGTGKISEEHLKYLRADANVELAAVCDLSSALAQYAVARFGASQAFTDCAKMLADVKPDVLHILTPPHTHFKMVSDALNAGAHVIVEKPVAPTNREFNELWKLAQSKKRLIVEDHNYRFNEPVLKIEQLLREGQLGEVREITVRMALPIRKTGGRYADENLPHPSHRMPAGVLHEFITHLCYLALRFLPSVDRVSAAWANVGGGTLFKYDDLDALVIGGPVHARIRFTAAAAPDTFSLTVRGSRGWAQTDLFQPYLRLVLPRKGGAQLSPLVNHIANGIGLASAGLRGFTNKVLQKTPYEGLQTFLHHTYRAFRERSQPPVTYDDMDRASRLVDMLVDEANRI